MADVTEQGRPAWRLVTPVEPVAPVRPVRPVAPVAPNKLAGPGNSGDQLEVIVDQETGGPEGANPQSRNVVSVAYRRGFDRIVVTTRSTGTARPCTATSTATCWADPLASGEGFRDEPERFTVGAGALAGAQAELVLSARGVPHVWTIDNRLVVTVAGDATGEELRRIAESFAPAG